MKTLTMMHESQIYVIRYCDGELCKYKEKQENRSKNRIFFQNPNR